MDRPGNPLKPIDKSLLDEAYELVTGDRQQSYGHPADNFDRIARLWSVALNKEIWPEDVAVCMVLVKVARQLHAPKRDNVVDAISYLLTLEAVR
ncbi:MAG TPA: DUF6378 domain-containing protein [Acidimicrobiia bacterium]